MLEVEIQKLTAEMAQLRQTVELLTKAVCAAADVATKPAPMIDAGHVRVEVGEVEHKVESDKAEKITQVVSRDDVQELCVELVRDDRSRKADIKEIIASFNGAATLKDVPEADLADLKAKLEALK